MAKIGIDKIVKEVRPKREAAALAREIEYEKTRAKQKEKELKEEKDNKILAQKWVKKVLPVFIANAVLNGYSKLRLGDSDSFLQGNDQCRGCYIDYVLKELRELEDIHITSTSYYGTGKTDVDGWTDRSYDTYYLEWDEPK